MAIRDVTLEIRAGEVVALVGANGSGKSTLAKLLCNLYHPSSGRILWDGTDFRDVAPSEIRRHIAVVFQDFGQYFLSARENVAIGDCSSHDSEGVARALVQAGADRVIDRLPDGLDTLLGKEFEGGYEISTGEWQRIALARAFFRDAPILVLDEPTAALDAVAEYELFEQIRRRMKGRTVLLISHRFSSVRSADRIVVLRHGEVVEQGSHRELMASGGLYSEMFLLQAAAYGLSEDNSIGPLALGGPNIIARPQTASEP